MLRFKTALELANVESTNPEDYSGWIIEGDQNVYVRYAGCFFHPFKKSDDPENPEVSLVFIAVNGTVATLRCWSKDTEIDIYTRPMVGDVDIVIDEEVFDKRFAVVMKDSSFEYYAEDDSEKLASVLADAYFDEDETIMTLGQFKAQPTYAQLAYFLNNAEELGYKCIKII